MGRGEGVLTNEGLQEGIDGVGLIGDEVLNCRDDGAAGVWPTCGTGGEALVGARQVLDTPALGDAKLPLASVGDGIGTSSHATLHIHLRGSQLPLSLAARNRS